MLALPLCDLHRCVVCAVPQLNILGCVPRPQPSPGALSTQYAATVQARDEEIRQAKKTKVDELKAVARSLKGSIGYDAAVGCYDDGKTAAKLADAEYQSLFGEQSDLRVALDSAVTQAVFGAATGTDLQTVSTLTRLSGRDVALSVEAQYQLVWEWAHACSFPISDMWREDHSGVKAAGHEPFDWSQSPI